MFLTTTLLALTPALPLQDATTSRGQRRAYEASEIVMRSFRPQTAGADDLLVAADQFVGRVLSIADDETGEITRHSNLTLFNESLLVFDTVENVERVLSLLERLDAVATAEREAEGKSRAKHASALEVKVVEYQPRYVGLRDLKFALNGFQRSVRIGAMTTGLDFVDDRGVVVIRETPDQIAAIQALLKGFDVARPQAVFTCWLVQQVEDEPSAHGLPRELVEGLESLVGDGHLKSRAMGMLRASVDSTELGILMEDGDAQHRLRLELTSFDREQGVLSLYASLLRDPGRESEAHLFSTQTAITSGEYTVLGATGEVPLFLVIRCQVL